MKKQKTVIMLEDIKENKETMFFNIKRTKEIFQGSFFDVKIFYM